MTQIGNSLGLFCVWFSSELLHLSPWNCRYFVLFAVTNLKFVERECFVFIRILKRQFIHKYTRILAPDLSLSTVWWLRNTAWYPEMFLVSKRVAIFCNAHCSFPAHFCSLICKAWCLKKNEEMTNFWNSK